VVGSGVAAVVADDLPATDHLANGEETEDLGRNDAGGDDLGTVHVPDLLQDVGGLLGSLGGGLGGSLEQPARVPRLLQGALPVALDSRDRTVDAVSVPFLPAFSSVCTHGGDIFWPRTTILATSKPTLE
jgi:hypothetical protein